MRPTLRWLVKWALVLLIVAVDLTWLGVCLRAVWWLVAGR